MKTVKIMLNNVEHIKDFVNDISKFEDNFDLQTSDGHYCVDAKSIMGIFSLNLSKPVILKKEDNSDLDETVLEIVERYVVK